MLPRQQITQIIQKNTNEQFSDFQDQKLLDNIFNLWDKILSNKINIVVNKFGDLELPLLKQQDEAKDSLSFPIKDFLIAGKQMLLLQNCAGFERCSKSFQNDQQFFDTIFEINCAYYCYTNFSNIILEFNPPVTVKDKHKFPEFRITHPEIGEIICECKNLQVVNKVKQAKTFKLARAIEANLTALKIPEHLQVEIFFKKLPFHFNRNLGSQLATRITKALKKNIIDKHIKINFKNSKDEIFFVCKTKNHPQYFQGASEFLAIDKNDLNNTASKEKAPFLILTKNYSIHTDCYAQIRDAYTQISPDRKYMFFLKPTCYLGAFNIERLTKCINIPKYKNLLAVLLMYPTKPYPIYPTINGKLAGQAEFDKMTFK